MTRANTAADFWARTVPGGDCLEWAGRMLPPKAQGAAKGYGLLRWQGRRQVAHRVSWQITHGPIPMGMQVCHHCDNPPCVNPKHLFLGTNADNQEDRRVKGAAARSARRRAQRAQKLSIEDAREIRALLALRQSKKSVARLYSVCPQMILRISRGQAWREVD
jgi:hypothetical protein